MASTFLQKLHVPIPLLQSSTSSPPPSLIITCGPRSKRGPLIRGRILSTEAILAVQSLKRTARLHPDDPSHVDRLISSSFLRLVKPDLLAALAELRRQGFPALALRLFLAARDDFSFPPDLYADMIAALSGEGGMEEEVDALAAEVAGKVERGEVDVRGATRVVKALVAAGRGEAVKGVYGAMRRGGWTGDDYFVRVLSKGLRRLGEAGAAEELERDYAACVGCGAAAATTGERNTTIISQVHEMEDGEEEEENEEVATAYRVSHRKEVVISEHGDNKTEHKKITRGKG